MTSKRQVTVPKELADRYGIEPGTQIDWQAAGDVIRVIPPGRRREAMSVQTRLALFDAATERQRSRQSDEPGTKKPGGKQQPVERGWTRDELYDRGTAPR